MVTERVGEVLETLSEMPYITVAEMAAIEGRGTTALDGHLRRAEKENWVSHVLHPLRGRNGHRRYMLTNDGVRALAEVLGVRTSEIMDRVGTTGRALARYYQLVDILAGVYQTAATVASCYSSPELRVHPLSDGPLDAVVRMPVEPYSLGVMVKRPSLRDDFFELKIWRYKTRMRARPSALLVVAPTFLAGHRVKRLVQRNWQGLFLLSCIEHLGDPDAHVWAEPNRRDGVERVWSMREVLRGLPEPQRDFEPDVAPYTRVAVPRPGWQPAIVLTPKQRSVLYAIADWPMARDCVLAALAFCTLSSLTAYARRLRAQGLVRQVRVRRGDARWALTDAGIRFICTAARAADTKPRSFWSSELRRDDKFAGSKLRKLRREIRHTDMVYTIVAGIARQASAAYEVEAFEILPAHLTEKRPVMPDARVDLLMRSGEQHILLLEAERDTLSRAEMRARLRNYARVFDTESFQAEFPTRPWIAVVLEDSGAESNFSEAQVEAGRMKLPIALTNVQELVNPGGFLQAVWRRPGEYGDRVPFWDL